MRSTAGSAGYDGDGGKQQCNEQGSGGIKVWVVEHVPEKNAEEGNEHSGEPGAVFKEDGEDSWVFTADDFVPRGLILNLCVPEFRGKKPQRIKIEYGSDREYGIASAHTRGRFGMKQMTNAFVCCQSGS